MDQQSSLTYDRSAMSVLRFASFVLPSSQYKTLVNNFPATNCNYNFSETGDFFHTYTLYQNGKCVARMHSDHCTETGHIEADFDELFGLFNEEMNGVIITDFHHTERVPAEIYFSHVHRKTGAYIAYPASPFMGDTLYQDLHATQLENTLFWPGIVSDSDSEVWMAIINPYKLSYSFQFSLFLPNGKRVQTKTQKIRPYCSKLFSIAELFPDYYDEVVENKASASICVSAQYKLIAYVLFKNRLNDLFTTIDHLHRYCLV